MKVKIIILILFFMNIGFSQTKKETTRFKSYSSYILKSYYTDKNWLIKYRLNNGLIQEEENYRNDEIKSIKTYTYDKNNNVIYQCFTFKNQLKNNKIDTLSEVFFKYDKFNKLVEKKSITRFSVTGLTTDASIVEEYSDFDKKSNARLTTIYSEDQKSGSYISGKKNREFNSKGNLIKEEKISFYYSEKEKSNVRFKTEILTYVYDKEDNLIEINRDFEPKSTLPFTGLDGLTIYAKENYEYEFDSKGIWLKKYQVINGQRKLLEERSFSK